MKNITITVNDDLYRHARVCAAQRGTNVTALVRDFLLNLNPGPESAADPRSQTIRDRLTADKNAIMMHKIRAYLGEEDGVGEKINTPPPSPL